ncbi:MAG: hypothetical protein AB7Q17_11805 [Phycisphaerae bacterium]
MNVRLRAAEQALDEGRLDDAYRAALEPDVRADRRGQRLLDALERPLLARARLHLQAGRYRAALDDLERLAAVARGGAELEALQERVLAALRSQQAQDAAAHDAYARAAEAVREGRLDSGRVAIEGVDDPQRRAALHDELDQRARRSAQLLEQARAALAAGDVLAACRFWADACQRHGRGADADALLAPLASAYRAQLDEFFAHGRLDRFATLLGATGAFRDLNPALREYDPWLATATQAAAALRANDFAAAREALLRLSALPRPARWVGETLAALAQLANTREKLLAGPLALLSTAPAAPRTAPDNDIRTQSAPRIAAPADTARLRRDTRLVLLVDGGGSSLLLSADAIRIGRAGAPGDVDVPIPADVHAHHADIVRAGDDYFLVAHAPTRVNQRTVQRTLMRHNDRVMLGERARFTFLLPSHKSASAVLKLADRCRLPQDVSQVVLFRDTCMLGPHAQCHVPVREADSRVVLFERDGRLFARRTAADGRPADAPEPVAFDQTMQVGDLRLTVKRYSPGSASA